MKDAPAESDSDDRPRVRNRSAGELSSSGTGATPASAGTEADEDDDGIEDDPWWWLLGGPGGEGEADPAAKEAATRLQGLRTVALSAVAAWAGGFALSVLALLALRSKVDGHMPPLLIPATGPVLAATTCLLSVLLAPWAVLTWRQLRPRCPRWAWWPDVAAAGALWLAASLGAYCLLSARDLEPSAWRIAGTTVFGLACLSTVTLLLVRCGFLVAAVVANRSIWRLEPCTARLLLAAVSARAVWSGFRPAEVVRVELFVAGLSQALDGYGLCAVSDLHAGPSAGLARVREVVGQLRRLDCEALVFNGDMAEGTTEQRHEVMEELSALASIVPDGAYWVPGNHEFYNFGAPGGGRAQAVEWTRWWAEHGVRPLNNSNVRLPLDRGASAKASFLLAGVDDPLGHPDLDAALAAPEGAEVPIVLAAHRPHPFAEEAAARGVAAQLSGHTHGGQLWPVHVPALLAAHGYLSGLYEVGKTQLYVSDGTIGTYMTRLRLLTQAEITQVRLRAQPAPPPAWREASLGVALSYASAVLAVAGALAFVRALVVKGSEASSRRASSRRRGRGEDDEEVDVEGGGGKGGKGVGAGGGGL